MSKVYQYLLSIKHERGGGFLLLLDPDSVEERHYLKLAEAARDCGVDALLVGTSFMLNVDFSEAVRKIKEVTTLPVIIFPGSFAQLTPHADAVLFSSLISGRNPNYLIDEQVKGAPLVKRYGLEPIATGYILIESGPLTSVQYISGTMPIPRTKFDIACAHALAAQYMGMKLVYLEAGSGAAQPVPVEMVRAVAAYIDIPIMVGGGLSEAEECARRIKAGASFVVVGNRFEFDTRFNHLRQLAQAAHPGKTVPV
ncbi:MAG: geranylgeranylglyceryl/heptaprenylglyceryl phosphate synthase [candidate division Zixibacteria bacterium]|nr:geranylgeranylglyceryl/heptaprenylglyceryl phosphate synthase [candidate division Zixibacteria bacterium]MDD5427241.1 geranylgeranylglyceryl/heptaprenylglyceryl phosphate synthase [candidate division Zixibacteria bacterium]